ncbi:MAG: 3'(2'),5'-bisphosphate nucleotidase CysQ [Balneolaceae bacterium]|nr:MAG: 3'(2'),5'-bisphosphate nucleotidase CysQ [Balneolaceae bacterium]
MLQPPVKNPLLELALRAANEAGRVILEHYRDHPDTRLKEDGSPLTIADRRSHEVIRDLLSESGIPLVSEEGDHSLQQAERYWLVDPLDGTKDFLACNDEFVVNIALIEGDYPVLGVMLAPALNELYCCGPGESVWSVRNGKTSVIGTADRSSELSMAVSRFHNSAASGLFAEQNDVKKMMPVGSALKFGRIALAEIDLYLRQVGTSEWDTAAGQAILEAAGGSVTDLATGERLRCGKEGRRNRPFVAMRAPYRFEEFRY